MFGLGFPELIVILVIIIMIFGVGKLPEIGSAVGRGIKSFKKASKESDDTYSDNKTETKDKQKPS